MNEKKYELTGDFIEILGRKLYRIRALRDFSYVKTGDLGGYIENENNFPITMQNYNKDNCITQINVNGIRNTEHIKKL